MPEDPVLLSGTLRSALDVFGDYDDAEIVRSMSVGQLSKLNLHFCDQYEALRRVNLLPGPGSCPEGGEEAAQTVFSNLDAPVSELGDNFSTGFAYLYLLSLLLPFEQCLFNREKQLLCMARALLRNSKVLLMDEVCCWHELFGIKSYDFFVRQRRLQGKFSPTIYF